MAKKQGSYEEQVAELDEILERIDQSETPIDELAKDVKRGTELIRALDEKLKAVESEVKDAFESLKKEDSEETTD
jgi:exodeoxyribonuclease VII small subunit